MFFSTDILHWCVKANFDSISVALSRDRVGVYRLESTLSVGGRELIGEGSSYDVRSRHGAVDYCYDSIGTFLCCVCG